MQYKIEHNGQSYIFNDVLCRISKLEYLEQFQDGRIYLNPLRRFIKHGSSENAKYDDCEGAPFDNGILLYNSDNCSIKFKSENAYVCYNNPILCCMQIVPQYRTINKSLHYFFPIDKQMQSAEFIEGDVSDYGAIFFSKEDFTKRFIKAANALNIPVIHRSVTYYDNTKPKELLEPQNLYKNVFYKKRPFEYQAEYRFLLNIKLSCKEDHFDLCISKIRDCSIIIPLTDFL